ncbi:helix-turn-helix domain-containing protein [Zymomonas mobilis]|uniref:helix-turn-helix domain-containing protein n=1 Tax=Zymomonas mobilis TaxID=542 RepID=UPI0021C46CB9|nr:helix-turn-helix domain-containing protein [Zymomonas mobilis]MCP9308710.1 helix-turn-helix domain-containing protein [Zymomonas mobilis]
MTASFSSSSHLVASSPMSSSLNSDLSSSVNLSDTSVLSPKPDLAPAPLSAELSSMSPNLVSPLEAADLSLAISASSSPSLASPLRATILPDSSTAPSPSSSSSASFEGSPFVDRLGRFKRGTYRSMLMQTGMSYDNAKDMADLAAEEFKNAKKREPVGATYDRQSPPWANSAHPEIMASNTNSAVTAPASDFDEIEYFDQMVSNGVDPRDAADIARKTAIARRRDPLERATRYKIRRRMPDPVHRDSYEVGEREKSVWKPVNPQEIGAYLEAVDQYSIKTKGLSDKAVRLLKMLFRMVDFKTGRLEPTLDTICDRVGYARATVVKLLRQLQDLGFIRWIRRSIKIKADGKGPRRKQTSNAYGFLSPKAWPELARQVFERVMRRRHAPIPDDIDHAQEADKAETKAIVESLPPEDFVKAISGDKEPTELIQLAKSIERADQREQEEQAKKAAQAGQEKVKTPKEDTSKKSQISDNQREFNSYTLSCYSYLSNTDDHKFETTEKDMDCLAPANTASTGGVLENKPETDRFTKKLYTLNLRPDQVAAILQHRNKRKEQRMMPLSPKDIADLLIKTGQMCP